MRPKAIASIVGTVPTTRLESAYPGVPVYRFIPNIPVEVGRGVLCYAPGALAAEGPEDERAEAVRARGHGDAAGRAADRPGDGDHELRTGLHALVVDAMASAGARHGIEPARPPAWSPRPWPAPPPTSTPTAWIRAS